MLIALASLDLFVWIGLTSWLEPKQMKTSPSGKKASSGLQAIFCLKSFWIIIYKC